jgi:hypothetical protein
MKRLILVLTLATLAASCTSAGPVVAGAADDPLGMGTQRPFAPFYVAQARYFAEEGQSPISTARNRRSSSSAQDVLSRWSGEQALLARQQGLPVVRFRLVADYPVATLRRLQWTRNRPTPPAGRSVPAPGRPLTSATLP